MLSVEHNAIAMRYYGGRINPANRKFLTIPANAKAYGRRAREFGSTLAVMVRRKQGKITPIALIDKKYKKKKRIPRGGVYYWLVRSVTQKADPSVLPTERKLATGITNELSDWLQNIIEKAGETIKSRNRNGQ